MRLGEQLLSWHAAPLGAPEDVTITLGLSDTSTQSFVSHVVIQRTVVPFRGQSDNTAMAADNLRLQDLNALLKHLKVSADAEHCSLIVSIDLGTTYSGYVLGF
jgi:hypothetical protein